MKKMMLAALVLIGCCFSGGCVGGLVDRGAGVAEDKLQAIEGEQYKKLKATLEANGGSIEMFDKNLDGTIDTDEMKNIPLVMLQNPTAAWWWSEEFWVQMAGLFAATFGWRGVRKFREAKSKTKSKYVKEEKEPAEQPVK